MRIDRGLLKDTELADAIGVTPLTLWRLFTKRLRPGNDFIAYTLHSLELKFEDLFEIQMEINPTQPE